MTGTTTTVAKSTAIKYLSWVTLALMTTSSVASLRSARAGMRIPVSAARLDRAGRPGLPVPQTRLEDRGPRGGALLSEVELPQLEGASERSRRLVYWSVAVVPVAIAIAGVLIFREDRDSDVSLRKAEVLQSRLLAAGLAAPTPSAPPCENSCRARKPI
ncbi:hypothetical protein GFY24_34480 [Nocardia sp. SYP-A9097]|uniref:hypothetical protein n=1 Tax=Nocardia sp. SYP-A9097 TaxID=2663237 RepID=UPI00129A59BB|nr:hypothetical protein [Nocardia sp. SYP-A9097]MRH92471.1 hypothetical protein [Nocardia sp. SYP-A9097]